MWHLLLRRRSTASSFLHLTRLSRGLHSLRIPIEDNRWPGWEVIVGIEVHAQLKTRRKLFSDAETSSINFPPNQPAHVSLHDAALPGTLPVLNPKCVKLAVRTALALGAEVQSRSTFDRKHYFYADLPSGYQITQRYAPIAKGGKLHLPKADVSVRIHQIQLEQDTAKSMTDSRRNIAHIDLNRAGAGLMEIVSEPDMRSPEEAGEYIRALQELLRSVGSSDGNMDQGSFRCDVNVSVRRIGDSSMAGKRCEIKNLNSARFAMLAIAAEARRHISLLSSGQSVAQETRGFDDVRGETFRLRGKEDAPDYRYMPDPNIPPLLLTEGYVEDVHKEMPELPVETRRRLMECGLKERDVEVLMAMDAGREIAFDGEGVVGYRELQRSQYPAVAYFDEIAKGREAKVVANWILHELSGQLTARGLTFSQNPLTARQLGDLIDLVQDPAKILTGTAAKSLLRQLLDSPNPTECNVRAFAEELSLLSTPQATGSGTDDQLRIMCMDVVTSMPEEVAAIRAGKMNVLNKLVGKVMKSSGGKADAKAARETLLEVLKDS